MMAENQLEPLREFLEFFQGELEVLRAEYGCHILNLDQVDEEFAALAACHGIVGALDKVVQRSRAILAVVAREFPGKPLIGRVQRETGGG